MAAPTARFTTTGALRGPAAVELLDEAGALLRRAPLPVMAIYLLGSLPFWLGVVYFFFDMTQSANAEARMPVEALALALLYFWMKTCQAVFARKLLALLEGDDEPWTFARWRRTALLQSIVAGSLPIIYPLALLATIPFAWVNAFYHSISVVATSADAGLSESCRESARLARLWPKQNHLMLGIVSLASFVLLLNLALLIFSLPRLLNSIFGIETVFDQSLGTWNNSSFYLCLFVFCYLLLNPLNKAVFVLRCFYGRSRASGADLRAELRSRKPAAVTRVLTAIVALFLVLTPARSDGPTDAPSASTPPASRVPAVPSSGSLSPAAATVDLNRAIDQVMRKDEFAWRMPRPVGTVDKGGFFEKLLDRFGQYTHSIANRIGKFLAKLSNWVFSHQGDHDTSGRPGTLSAGFPWHPLIIFLAVLVILLLCWVGVSRWHRLDRLPAKVLGTLTPVRSVDLEDETVQADELPEDSWLALARQLIENGERRLALRALYLATLAALARQELVRLAATKSNRDYITEVTRRLRGDTTIVPYFRENVRLFEASWYGTHDATGAVTDEMLSNQQQVRGHVAA